MLRTGNTLLCERRGRGWPACPKAYALREAYENTFGEMCLAEITCSGAYLKRREKIIGRAQGAWLRAFGVQIFFPDQTHDQPGQRDVFLT